MADATLVVKIVTDYAQGAKGIGAAETGVGRMQNRLSKMAAPAAVAIGAIALFGKTAVDAASRTQQAIGAVDSVFGKNAGTIKRWADGAASSVGLAKSEYMELASVMGAQLKNMGIPLDQVAGKTNDLVKLGADLAATYGGTTKQAVEALGSALRGETDPIERYGVSVKQADIAAQQAKDGTDDLTGAAGKQAKTMALLSLVSKQSADAQGQFAREADSAAGAAQINAAKTEDMKAALGEALLPAVTAVTQWLTKLVTLMTKHKTVTLVAITVIGLMAVAILALNVAVGIYTAVTTLAASATLAAWVAAAWPILAVVAAVALVVAGIVLLWKHSETFRTVVLAVWGAIKTAFRATVEFIKRHWLTMLAIMLGPLGIAARLIIGNWGKIKAAAVAAFNLIKTAWNTVMSALKTAVNSAKTVVLTAWNAIKTAVGAVKSAVEAVKTKLGQLSVPGVVKTALDNIKTAVGAVSDAVENLIGWIRDIPTPSIDWPSPPKWLSKVGITSSSLGMPGPSVGRFAAPTGRSGRAVSTSSSGTVININVTGALDPETVARQINRLLGNHDRRMGARPA